jgi:hypothetical protein
MQKMALVSQYMKGEREPMVVVRESAGAVRAVPIERVDSIEQV